MNPLYCIAIGCFIMAGGVIAKYGAPLSKEREVSFLLPFAAGMLLSFAGVMWK